MKKKMTRFAKLTAVVAVLCLLPVAASANTIVQSLTFSMLLTNWTSITNPPAETPLGAILQFDSNLGALDKVTIQFDSMVTGDMGLENKSAASGNTITGTLSSLTQLFGPNGLFVQLNPSVQQIFSAPTFDGVIDFGGTSGITYSDLASSVISSTTTITSAGLLAAYQDVAPAQLSFFVQALGASIATGGGNTASSFTTLADANVTVTYDWHDVGVPEPVSLVLIGSGLLGLGILGRKRFSR